ncbi:MAG: phosphoglycerate dehydrogenase [Lentisphaerae bacterium GWF2_52_8]|nr:MAG: phosphoglycerate dehydrogenase [Lentisphaerae bacterium GWF2_52_8]
MYKILISGKIHELALRRLAAEPDFELIYKPDLPLSGLKELIGPCHCIITRSETPVQRELIDCAPNLKVIAIAAVGTANVDIDYATEKGILVMNTPGKNTNSAAELTMALLLSAVRKLQLAHQNMQRGAWDRHQFSGVELMGKTIGIIGLGNVGHRVAKFALGFDMRVLAYDPYISDETFVRNRAEKTDLETLVKNSDVISVHTPKNKETSGMLGAREIAMMKKGVFILNAARGGIINEPALLEALKSGQVAAAGIDTWNEEPPKDNPFKDIPNVVMSPHIGASTEEAQRRIGETIAEQVPKALRGGVVDAPVNMPQIRMIEGNLMSSYVVLAEKLGSFAAQYMEFTPETLDCIYRGDIGKEDCTLLRLAFLKGYLTVNDLAYVSYVNAEQRAASVGLSVRQIEDSNFTDYESAAKFVFSGDDHEFEIGGVVFSGPHPRITLVDGYVYEVEPSGTFLLVRCNNKLGVLSAISQVLDNHGVLIKRIDFSHSQKRKRTMFMFRIGRDVSDQVLAEIQGLEHTQMVRRIII